MKLMTLEEIRERLKDKRLQIVAKAINLSYPTLKKISDGKYSNCTQKTIFKLTEYLK